MPQIAKSAWFDRKNQLNITWDLDIVLGHSPTNSTVWCQDESDSDFFFIRSCYHCPLLSSQEKYILFVLRYQNRKIKWMKTKNENENKIKTTFSVYAHRNMDIFTHYKQLSPPNDNKMPSGGKGCCNWTKWRCPATAGFFILFYFECHHMLK